MKCFAKDQRSFFNLGFKFCIQLADGKCYSFKLFLLFNQTFFSFLALGNIDNKCNHIKMVSLLKEAETDFHRKLCSKAVSSEKISPLAHLAIAWLFIKPFTKRMMLMMKSGWN